MKHLSKFYFGSQVHGLFVESSDEDYGEVVLQDSVVPYLNFDSGNQSMPKNKQQKANNQDVLVLDVASLFQQCLHPSVQTLQTVFTLTNHNLYQMCKEVLACKNYVAMYYRSKSFQDNCKKTPKGKVQKLVSLEYLFRYLYMSMDNFDPTVYEYFVNLDSEVGEAVREYLSTETMSEYYMNQVDQYCTYYMEQYQEEALNLASVGNAKETAGNLFWEVLLENFSNEFARTT